MLKNLFGSGARVKLVRQFLNHQDSEFFIRELTRILDEQINSLRRELENLENVGMLKSREKNRRKYYRVNPHFLLLHEFTSIVRKTDERHETFLKKLNKLGDVDLCVLSGQFIGKETDLDLFIVGNLDEATVKNFVLAQFPEAGLKPGVMKREDFLYRIALKDKFIQDLFGQKDNLVLKNKLKKDTESLIA